MSLAESSPETFSCLQLPSPDVFPGLSLRKPQGGDRGCEHGNLHATENRAGLAKLLLSLAQSWSCLCPTSGGAPGLLLPGVLELCLLSSRLSSAGGLAAGNKAHLGRCGWILPCVRMKLSHWSGQNRAAQSYVLKITWESATLALQEEGAGTSGWH